MILCKDCRYLVRGMRGPSCWSPNRTDWNPIDGSVTVTRRALEARADIADCGERGRWFAPKLWARLCRTVTSSAVQGEP